MLLRISRDETERQRLDAIPRQRPSGVLIAEAPSGRIRLEEIPMVRALAGQTVTGQEMRFPRQGGDGWTSLVVNAAPILDAEDQVVEAVLTITDNTERERAEEAGFDRHLTKPVDLAALAKLLAQVPAQQSAAASKR